MASTNCPVSPISIRRPSRDIKPPSPALDPTRSCARTTSPTTSVSSAASVSTWGVRPAADLPTIDRIRGYKEGNDPQLVALLFQYGRYLLIASSRPGTQAANLQGIWNDEVRPPWSSNYTVNINTEMNYWPAEPTNLAECHEPLFRPDRGNECQRRETARINYGADGWVAHHNADLWRQTAPVGDFGQGDPVWACWPMAGPWLCQHLWERYVFSGDVDFLRERAYPLMKGAAEFCSTG